MKKCHYFLFLCVFLVSFGSSVKTYAVDHEELRNILDGAVTSMELFSEDALAAYRAAGTKQMASEIWKLVVNGIQISGGVKLLVVTHEHGALPNPFQIKQVISRLNSLSLYFDLDLSGETKAILNRYPSLSLEQIALVQERLGEYTDTVSSTDTSKKLLDYVKNRIQQGNLESEAAQILRVSSITFFSDDLSCIGEPSLKGNTVVGTCLVYGAMADSEKKTLFGLSVYEEASGTKRGVVVTLLSSEDDF